MTEKIISPLRRRMTFLRPPKRASTLRSGSAAAEDGSRRRVEDMTVRGFTPCARRGYIRLVKDFTVFFGRSPNQAGAEDLRRYQFHMRTSGASAPMMNTAV